MEGEGEYVVAGGQVSDHVHGGAVFETAQIPPKFRPISRDQTERTAPNPESPGCNRPRGGAGLISPPRDRETMRVGPNLGGYTD